MDCAGLGCQYFVNLFDVALVVAHDLVGTDISSAAIILEFHSRLLLGLSHLFIILI